MFIKRKKQDPNHIRTLSEDILKGVANRGQLEATWSADTLVRRDNSLMEQGLALELLESDGFAERVSGGWHLTKKGHNRALELLRAHRLVETYLARKEGIAPDDLHAVAEKAEHEFSAEGINKLADSMNRPRFDPHGDPIPERSQDLTSLEQVPLLDMEAGMIGRIAHIEDEPKSEFRKLLDKGLALELPIKVIEKKKNRIVIELTGESIELSSRLAAHVEVIPVDDPNWYPEGLNRLSLLNPGETGIVEYLSPACMGPERRRLMDFGIVPGSEIQCEFSSPFGSPIAYSLRGTTVALRQAQARKVFIRRKA